MGTGRAPWRPRGGAGGISYESRPLLICKGAGLPTTLASLRSHLRGSPSSSSFSRPASPPKPSYFHFLYEVVKSGFVSLLLRSGAGFPCHPPTPNPSPWPPPPRISQSILGVVVQPCSRSASYCGLGAPPLARTGFAQRVEGGSG